MYGRQFLFVPIASIVIIQFFILIRSKNSGIAVVPFDLSSTLVPAIEIPKSCKKTDTI